MTTSESKLDTTDRRILKVLQEDGRIPNSRLAERVNLSETPCWRRIKRLEQEGYILGYGAHLNRPKLGLGVIGFAQITLGDHSGDNPRLFEQQIQDMPEVLSCHNVSGECDYILQVVAQDLEAYGDLVRDRLRTLPGVTSVQTSLSLREIKADGRLPIIL